MTSVRVNMGVIWPKYYIFELRKDLGSNEDFVMNSNHQLTGVSRCLVKLASFVHLDC